ncbi:hypothetical protein J2Z50_003437 [Ensifer mexicanus]|nr:hypothetical protein [Sinorhizobium mexicanum]
MSGALDPTGVGLSPLLPVQPDFAANQVVVTGFGGDSQEAFRKALFEPFSGSKLLNMNTTTKPQTYVRWARQMMSAGTSYASPGSVDKLCLEGILETLNWRTLGLNRTKFMSGDQTDCAVLRTYLPQS